MSEEQEKYVVNVMPEMSVAQAVTRYNEIVQFVSTIMKRDIDYGVIPGTDKPTLLKPGAEKLATFFGLRPRFQLIDKVEDWDKGRFYYRYSCELWRGSQYIANGEGSANSMEKRYRWRYVPEFKASEEEKAKAVRREVRKSKGGHDYAVLVLENDDQYTLVNTLQKIAQKRALIAAVLVAVNASQFFTQDLEDMLIEEDESLEVEKPSPQDSEASGVEKMRTEPGIQRPANAFVVRDWLRKKADSLAKDPPPAEETLAKMRGLYAGKLAEALQSKDSSDRHLFNRWVFGVESTSNLKYNELAALLSWLVGPKDSTGDYPLKEFAVEEAANILRQAQRDSLYGETEPQK